MALTWPGLEIQQTLSAILGPVARKRQTSGVSGLGPSGRETLIPFGHADANRQVVRFATASDESLFVSRYVLELPSEETLRRWLHEERERLEQELAANGGDSAE